MSDNGTQELPQGWDWTTFGEVSKSDVEQDGPEGNSEFLYVDIGSINNRTKKIAEPKTLPKTEAPSRARQCLKPGDVLISMTRPTDRSAES